MQQYWRPIWRRIFGCSLALGTAGAILAWRVSGFWTAVSVLVGVAVGLLNQLVLGSVLARLAEDPERARVLTVLGMWGRTIFIGGITVIMALAFGPAKTMIYLAGLLGVQVVAIAVTATGRKPKNSGNHEDSKGGD